MKSKSVILLIVLCLMISLVGCSKNQPSTSGVPSTEPLVTDTANNETTKPNNENNGGLETVVSGKEITVSINKFLEYINPETFDEKVYISEHEGVVSAKIDESGNLVVVMLEEQRNKIVESLKGGLEAILDGLVNNGDTPYIKKVDFTDNYRELKLTVENEGFFKNREFVTNFVIHSVGAYQTYSGLGYDITFVIVDSETGEVLLTEKYPDKYEEDWKKAQEAMEKALQEGTDKEGTAATTTTATEEESNTGESKND